jgi:hypothetical protein
MEGNDDPVMILLGDREQAKWISPDAEQKAELKKPDYAGYEYDSQNYSTTHDDPKVKIFNRIPGDAKLYKKFNHAMLPPNRSSFKKIEDNPEVQKVLNQIHGYMDQREARYGYIITDQELICF